jgi:hypothetical protein
MHRNTIWLGLLAVISLCTLWYSATALMALQKYTALSAETRTVDSHWSYIENSGSFFPFVMYVYEVGDKRFQHSQTLRYPMVRNESAAQEMVRELSSKRHTIWYDPQRPSLSVAEKNLPIKECLSALTLLGIFGYFIWLGYSVGFKEQKR